MHILNTYFEAVPSTLGIIAFAIGIALFIILGPIGLSLLDDGNPKGKICVILAICGLILVILTANNILPFDHKEIPHYEIIVEDDYPVSQLIEQYEITEVKGEILDCIDKDAG